MEIIEMKMSEVMTPAQRALHCFSAIEDALAAYKCKLDVSAILKDGSVDFDVKVIPEEGVEVA